MKGCGRFCAVEIYVKGVQGYRRPEGRDYGGGASGGVGTIGVGIHALYCDMMLGWFGRATTGHCGDWGIEDGGIERVLADGTMGGMTIVVLRR